MKCELCGQDMKAITRTHLLAKHGTTTAAYRALGHETMSAEQRAHHASFLTHRIKTGDNLGANHPRWKGGHIARSSGYRLIWVGGKLCLEHRVVMARHLGRPLARSECIHHIDGDRANNAIDNLELFPSQSAHIAYHQSIGQTEYGKKFTLPPRNWASSPHKAMNVEYIAKQREAGRTITSIAEELGVERHLISRRLAVHYGSSSNT